MRETDITKRPKPDAEDVAHAFKKAGLSAIPGVGGPASEVFSLVVTPSLEKRRDEWIESIGKALKALEEKVKGFKIENLKNNEAFISVLMHSSQAAIKNHQKEKLEALRNAVLNTALPNAPEEDLQLKFLTIVDSLTPMHLTFLKRLDKYPVIRETEIPKSFFSQCSKDERDLWRLILRDLNSHGLTDLMDPWEAYIVERSRDDREENVTDLGKKFLTFIASPFNMSSPS